MSKWLFFPSPAAAEGPLQTITWTMTSTNGDNATVSSSGQEIISTTKTSQLNWGASNSQNLPRFWNGAEAVNGANYSSTSGTGSGTRYYFTSGATSRAWWDNYAVTYSYNGGTPISLNDYTGHVAGSCQSSYINTQQSNINSGSAYTIGDTLTLVVTDAP
jgi:hypothetical protein